MFFSQEGEYQDNRLHKFKQLVLKDKINLLQSKTTLPKKYWVEEKNTIIKMIKKRITLLSNVLNGRMDNVRYSCELYTHYDSMVQDEDLEIFKEQWVYSMSYMMHEIIEINELKNLLRLVENIEYNGF